MTESPRKILRFKRGAESYPTIMTEMELLASPFSYSVNSALSHIEELYNSFTPVKDKEFSDFKYVIPNNIVSFLGNRGTGKTSCMRTATSLCKARHEDWLILDEIDPSFFDDKHNILDIFIGTLYGMFKNEMKKWGNLDRNSQDKLRKINDEFRKVKSALRYVKGNIEFDDNYETDELRHLDEGGRLRPLLYELIAGLLKSINKKFLVVSIDDLDLNISCSYEMLEQLRKYLILPNVVIIIAAKFDQLFDNVNLVLTRHYKDIPGRVSQKDVAEMAERYLNKVLPLIRRCEMPLVDSYIDAIMLIDNEIDDCQKDSERLVSVRVPDLIFKKTRYLFYNTAGIPSLVIPRNLRDLRMLVSMLVGMDDYTDDNKNNQKVFQDYFFGEWMGIIDPGYRPFIRRLLEEEDLAKLNRFVVSNLYNLFLKNIEPLSKSEQEVKDNAKQNVSASYMRRQALLNNIINPRNSYWNVSVGDVIVIMNAIRDCHDSAQTLALLFVITTFYSMRLYETYNQMTDMTDKDGLIMPVEQPATIPVLKTSVRADIPPYFRLVGGAFFAGDGDSFIPMGQSDKEQRESRMINAGFLIPEIRSVVSEYKNLESQKIGSASSRLKTRLRLCEFFMLTITDRVDLKRGIDRRLINEPLYFTPFGANSKNQVFDVTRPFLSSVYPKLAYDRFNNDIYNIALGEEDSLLNRMRKHGESRQKDNRTWELMSKAAIRNMEILEDLTAWMYRKRYDIRPGNNGLLGILIDYFDEFEIVEALRDRMPSKGYCVKTYHKSGKISEGGSEGIVELPYYRIDYSIYSELGKFLKELDEASLSSDVNNDRKDLRNLFDAIMSERDIFILRDGYNNSEVREILYPFCSQSVVDGAIDKKKEKISLTDLSLILAKITVEHSYDFTGRLPKELELSYHSAITIYYNEENERLKRAREQLDDSISSAKEDVRSKMEDIKLLQQEKAQYSKSIVTAEEECNRINGEIIAREKDLSDVVESSKRDGMSKSKIASLEKKIADIKKNINAHEGKMKEAYANITLYREHLNNAVKQLEEKEKKVKDLNKTIRNDESAMKKIDANIKMLNNNFNNRISI